jgi:hypothetical protein
MTTYFQTENMFSVSALSKIDIYYASVAPVPYLLASSRYLKLWYLWRNMKKNFLIFSTV